MKREMQVAGTFNIAERLEAIRMSDRERLVAKAALRHGGMLADFLFQLNADVRRAMRLVRRGARPLPRSSKRARAQPVPR